MKAIQCKTIVALSSIAALLAFGGCDRAGGDRTVGQRIDSGAGKTQGSSTQAKQDAKDASTSTASGSMNSPADSTKPKVTTECPSLARYIPSTTPARPFARARRKLAA